jgi:hypothetical protein
MVRLIAGIDRPTVGTVTVAGQRALWSRHDGDMANRPEETDALRKKYQSLRSHRGQHQPLPYRTGGTGRADAAQAPFSRLRVEQDRSPHGICLVISHAASLPVAAGCTTLNRTAAGARHAKAPLPTNRKRHIPTIQIADYECWAAGRTAGA